MKGYEVTRRSRRNIAALKTPRRTARPKKKDQGCFDCVKKDIELVLLRNEVEVARAASVVTYPRYLLTTAGGDGNYTFFNTGTGTTFTNTANANLTVAPGVSLSFTSTGTAMSIPSASHSHSTIVTTSTE